MTQPPDRDRMKEIKEARERRAKGTGGAGGEGATNMNDQDDTERLRGQVRRTQRCLAQLIVWMASSANTPIRPDEAEELLKVLGEIE